jgi:hypothetical protein
MKKPVVVALPESHLAALDRAGFTVVRYLDKAIKVKAGDMERQEWLPALCIAPADNPQQYRVIQWLPKGHCSNHYTFDGWQVSDGRSFGGLYETISQALGWFEWKRNQHV